MFASPRMSAKLAMNIAAELAKVDPEGAGTYAANAQAYAERMNALADEMAEALSPIMRAFNQSSGGYGQLGAFCFLIFNLLCAPCFAAMGAMKREMNSGRWTVFAIGYQCLFAYVVALIVFQTGKFLAGAGFVAGTAAALIDNAPPIGFVGQTLLAFAAIVCADLARSSSVCRRICCLSCSCRCFWAASSSASLRVASSSPASRSTFLRVVSPSSPSFVCWASRDFSCASA